MQQVPTPHTEIGIRLEKLHFLVEELALAEQLCGHASHSDMARMISRHVAVRTSDFVNHARQLRNRLPPSSARSGMKLALDAYDAEFQDHLAPARNKLSAHVQDMGFADRLDMWAAIDASKVSYFAEGARELWDSIAATGVAGHQPFSTPSALADPSVASVLADLAGPVAAMVTVGTDPLADARANTSAMFNATPIHQRAGQIALLRRWLRLEGELLARFRHDSPVGRMLKARVLSDVVNLHDCLITRAVQVGAPQELKGLDRLVAEAGEDPSAIRKFSTSHREETTIDPLRSIRNRVCSHLEDNPSVPLAVLLAELDGDDMLQARRHLLDLEATFERTCRDVFFLSVHLTDGMRIRAALANPASPPSFDPLRPDALAQLPPRPNYTREEMRGQLDGWVGGDPRSREEALWYFRDAFAHAPVVETRPRTEALGAGAQHFHQLKVRSSHLLLLGELLARDEAEADQLLQLAASCPGFPQELAEILLEYHTSSGRSVSPSLLLALGELAPWWMEDARALVAQTIGERAGPDRLLARAMLLRIYLREEGPRRMNRAPGPPVWPDVKAMATAGAHGVERLTAPFALAGAFLARPVGGYIRRFEAEYREIADQAFDAAGKILAGTLGDQGRSDLRRLLHRGELAQATLAVASTGPRGHAADAKAALLNALALGIVTPGHNTDERFAIAECLALLGHRLDAFEAFERIAQTEPANVEARIRAAETLADAGGSDSLLLELAKDIQARFRLDQAAETRLVSLEARFPLAKR